MEPAETQIVTLEQSKKIKDIGIDINTYFVWDDPQLNGKWEAIEKWMVEDNSVNMIPAPTAQELLAKMPVCISAVNDIQESIFCSLIIYPKGNEYSVLYKSSGFVPTCKVNKNLAETLGQMLIWLHKESYLK